jgi:hypothetical protein
MLRPEVSCTTNDYFRATVFEIVFIISVQGTGVEILMRIERGKFVRPVRTPEDEVRIMPSSFESLLPEPHGHVVPMTGQIPIIGG